MTKTIEIHLPDTIAHYEGDLRLFIDLMVFKLNLNRHKDGPDAQPVTMHDMLQGEVKELRDALLHESQCSVAFEAVDVANMAFLCSLYAGRMTKLDFEKGRV